MPNLPQAAVSCVGHQDMAHYTCGRVPSVPRLVDSEEEDVPVEIRLEVPRRHTREAPQVALQSGAQVVHHLHPLQVDRVVGVGPVRLALVPAFPDQRVVRPLVVVDQQRRGAILPLMVSLTRTELGLPLPQTTATGFLWTSMAT